MKGSITSLPLVSRSNLHHAISQFTHLPLIPLTMQQCLNLEMHLQQRKKNLNMEPTSQARVYCGNKNSGSKVKDTTYVAKLERLASVLIISLSHYCRSRGVSYLLYFSKM
jgi:hypothetical protein